MQALFFLSTAETVLKEAGIKEAPSCVVFSSKKQKR